MFAINKKTGLKIIGTSETIPGTAGIVTDSFEKAPDGSVHSFEWDGETDVHWDGQETDEDDNERLFVDSGYNTCKESELELVETDPEDKEDD